MNALEHAQQLQKDYGELDGVALLEKVVPEFSDGITAVSSFGAESALLLSMIAEVDSSLPITFLDTKKLFDETLEYRDLLSERLGLTNVKTIYPDYNDIQRADPEGTLWERDVRACCTIRKVIPLQKALKPYKAWITGRKRHQGGLRGELPLIEAFEGRVKVNPLAKWNRDMIWDEFKKRDLPLHPLYEQGYLSIGCAPCTALPSDPNDPRSGRWSGQDKTECGIHITEDGKILRTSGTS